MNVLFQLDWLDPNSAGTDYLNLSDLGTDTRLENKYTVIANAMWLSPETANQDRRDWMSVLEAVERDLASLTNDYKYRKLIALIDQHYKESGTQLSLDDMYSNNRGEQLKGPWNAIVEAIRKDIEEVEVMKDRIEALQRKQQEMTVQQMMLKKEKEELLVIKAALETRLTETLVKAEQVPTLEFDKKRLIEKE